MEYPVTACMLPLLHAHLVTLRGDLYIRVSYRIFRLGGGGGGGGISMVGRQIPMSINMPQLIFQRAESAPLSGGQSISSLGEGGLLLGGGGGGSV